MKYVKKTISNGIIIVVLFFFSSIAYSSGFIFKWEPFKVDKDLFFINQEEKSVIDKSPVPRLKAVVSEDKVTDLFDLSTEKEPVAIQKPEKKSFLDNIKIKISPTDSITADKQKIYANSDEEQVSKVIDAMTSLIYDDKKIKSLENIGKIIEPTINFYFEF